MTDTPIRPLLFSKIRLSLGGQAEFFGALLDREKERLMRDLDKARTRVERANETEVEELKQEALHVVTIRGDITTGLIDPRMDFLNIRLYRDGMANTFQDVLLDEQDRLLDHLSDQRAKGLTEDDPAIEKTRQELVWVTSILRDVGIALMHLAGPDRDPR